MLKGMLFVLFRRSRYLGEDHAGSNTKSRSHNQQEHTGSGRGEVLPPLTPAGRSRTSGKKDRQGS